MTSTIASTQTPPYGAADPSQAQGAQIPLKSFTIPTFPETPNLRALTLTSDIKVDEYDEELKKPFAIPPLPPNIESLTLEFFTLGYPAGFLAALADRLPNVKSLVIYTQVFGGTTEESKKDAVLFFKKLRGLRSLHLLDVFAKPHFFESIAPWLKFNDSEDPAEARRGLMFLEVSYTFRHEDENFMGTIQATEIPLLIGPGLIGCTLNVSEPEKAEDDEQDPSNIQEAGNKEGIMAFNKTLAEGFVDALTNERSYPRGLRALNSTLYTLTPADLDKVLSVNKNIMVLNVTTEVEPGETYKKGILKSLQQCEKLTQVEVVANPSLRFFMEVQNPRSEVLAKTFPSKEDMEMLSSKCGELISFKANILRTTTFGAVSWDRKDGEWIGGVLDNTGKELPQL